MPFTPARQRGREILDDPATDPALAVRSLKDVALANLLFGGRRAILRELRAVLKDVSSSEPLCLLDIGTGLGDIPAAATREARHRRQSLDTIGVELAPSIAAAARRSCSFVVVADATHLPFADHSVDVVTCSQVLHHFDDAPAERLLRECTRVSRRAIVIGDLRRSWLAVAGLWITSFGLGFHPVSRQDGVTSILRGFTRPELAALVERATGRTASVRHALGWRVTATWSPQPLQQHEHNVIPT